MDSQLQLIGLLSGTAAATFVLGSWYSQRSALGTKEGKNHKIRPQKVIESCNDCPYEYILNLYGRNHFSGFVDELDPKLKTTNKAKWDIVCEIMDAIHFCLILVDDVTDDSDCRHGLPAAHRFWGSGETANRAYLALVRVMDKTARDFPTLLPFLVANLREILEGQDLSLVWRRDGTESLPPTYEARLMAYRRSAGLKTGALFRLVGQLVTESPEHDVLMTQVGWYSQLQNDCKNVYSSEYDKSKGAAAEDLRNGELSYPIIIGLNHPQGYLVEKALGSRNEAELQRALGVLQSEQVKAICLAEFKEVGRDIPDWVKLWGRKEKMDKAQV